MSATEGVALVNAHTHLYSGLAPLGMPAPSPEPTNFVEILERVWLRLDRALDESSLDAAARYYVTRAIELGTRALVDHHESPEFLEGSLDVLADACQELGMPALLCYGATERNGGREEAQRGLAECRRFLETNERPLVRGVVGLHASFTVSDETLREAGDLARELSTVLHVHVAEDMADVRDAVERGYAGVLDRLIANGAWIPGSLFAHGVHLSPDEVLRAREMGMWFVQNPRSNAGNQVGYPSALRAGARVALGTDGFESHMQAEAEFLEQAGPDASEAAEVVARRLANGEALFLERFGADLPAAAGLEGIDLDRIRARAQEEATRLWQRMGQVG